MHVGISALHVRPGRSGSHEPYMVHLVRALSELEVPHKFTLFCTPENRVLFETHRDRFEPVVYPRLAEKVLCRIVLEQLALPREVTRRGIDVLHYGGTAGSFLIRRSDVVTIHHDSVTQRSSMSMLRNLYYDVVLRFNRRAGLLIVPSKVYAEEMIHHYGYRPAQMRPVHHGTSSDFVPQPLDVIREVQEKWGMEKGAILTVTNTLPHKNVRNLLRAFDSLLNQNELRPQLVMVGNVKVAILEQIINEVAMEPARLRSRIKLIPFLPNHQLPPLYAAAAVFVFVSQQETFGMPLTEAMACGLPIVASDIPVHREVLQGNALVVSPEDVEGISDALYTVLTNAVISSQLREAGLRRGRAFSWNEVARRTVRVYEEAARQGRSENGKGLCC
ncbi:glycosyltransferase family 4 protein [Chloroflexota bacterium]